MLAFPPDWTFLGQIVLFLVLWAVLRRVLFEPNLVLLADREHNSAGALQEATEVKGQEYRTQLAEARSGAMQEVDAVYREAQEQSQELVEQAREESSQTLAQLRQSLESEIAEARHDLEQRIPDFSNQIAARLLGRSLT